MDTRTKIFLLQAMAENCSLQLAIEESIKEDTETLGRFISAQVKDSKIDNLEAVIRGQKKTLTQIQGKYYQLKSQLDD